MKMENKHNRNFVENWGEKYPTEYFITKERS